MMKKTGLLLTALLLITMLFSGCFPQKKTGVTQGSSAPQTAASSGSVSSRTEQTGSSQAPDSPSASASVVDPGETESQEGPVIPIETDNKEFDALFKKNPIDKNYWKESKTAISTVDMIELSDKYVDIWEKEIEHAYSELEKHLKTDSSGKAEKLEAEQKKWEDGKDASIRLIAQEAQKINGTMAQVVATSKTMDFYRSRAAQIYRELYDYDENFSYAYSVKK